MMLATAIDLASDSLDKISLLVCLQKTFGVEIAENKRLHHPTLGQSSEFIRKKGKILFYLSPSICKSF